MLPLFGLPRHIRLSDFGRIPRSRLFMDGRPPAQEYGPMAIPAGDGRSAERRLRQHSEPAAASTAARGGGFVQGGAHLPDGRAVPDVGASDRLPAEGRPVAPRCHGEPLRVVGRRPPLAQQRGEGHIIGALRRKPTRVGIFG
eukprot:2596473-Pyramimonas_sp.AAC.1